MKLVKQLDQSVSPTSQLSMKVYFFEKRFLLVRSLEASQDEHATVEKSCDRVIQVFSDSLNIGQAY